MEMVETVNGDDDSKESRVVIIMANIYRVLTRTQVRYTVPHLILIATPWEKYYYYLYLMDKKNEAQGSEGTFPGPQI